MTVRIGTSGWQYRHWRGAFYPAGVASPQWLAYYAASFATVEVNSVFYRLPAAETFDRWRDATPEGFDFAMKASSVLTHRTRLVEPAGHVARLVERAGRLGDKLGPILLQLPPTLRAEPQRLDDTLSCFPPQVRVAVEARHPSWDAEGVWEILAAHGAAWCAADAPWRRWPLVRTADWGYVRFHQGAASPPPCYGRRALATWSERLASAWPNDEDVYAYFNNDTRACALRDARAFAASCTRAGLGVTRVPARGVVRLGAS